MTVIKNIMLLFGLIMILGSMQSCGQNTKKYYKTETEVVEKEVEVVQEFEGKYYMENNGFIEIYQSEYAILISSSNQLLTTINPQNNTFGELPRISGEYTIVDNKVKISRNLNYTSGNDIEEDVSGNDITGQRRTDITIELVDERLQITYEIYSDRIGNNANFIVATRILKED